MTSKFNLLEMLMSPTKNPCIGSSFDDFLREAGIFEEVQQAALRKVAAALRQQRRQGLPLSYPPAGLRSQSGLRTEGAGMADADAEAPCEVSHDETGHDNDSVA